MNVHTFLLVFHVLCNLQFSKCTDFTYPAFGTNTVNLLPAAFGDFNSDELTDMFVIENSDEVGHVRILLGSLKEPYFSLNPKLSCSHNTKVTSVVPGDYDGDGLMDVLTTVVSDHEHYVNVYVHWGQYNGESLLNCTTKPLLNTLDEPLAITYRTDLRTDIVINNGNLTIVRISKDRKPQMRSLTNGVSMKYPHSHAFLDINEDNFADLVLTTSQSIQIWRYTENENSFVYDESLSFMYPSNQTVKNNIFGQLLFIDLESSDKMYAVLPVIQETAIYVYSFEFKQWFKLPINFENSEKKKWSFSYREISKKSSWLQLLPSSKHSLQYMDVPTLRAGDFNNDGFIDLLATLQCENSIKTFLLENSPCNECDFSRTFEIRWTDLSPNNDNAVMGVFFDFMQDGILEVIFVQHTGDAQYSLSAYKNSLDYDANFIKVMVISGIDNTSVEIPASSILGKKRFFGSNLPGPKIRYKTTNQDGIPQYGRTSQLAQSAHFALNLPYTIFGLGRSPNFVEDLIIGMFNKTKQISPIIPNSQLVIRIPNTAATDTSKWRAQLFVTPSKIMWQTVFALTGTCIVLAVIIGVLHWKERREDRMERLQESQRGFHFDAM